MSSQLKLCNVQQKISCIFESIVAQQNGNENNNVKRPRQTFSVEASETLRSDFVEQLANLTYSPTEKVDGTSVLIKLFNNKPWLWARHDRKLIKQAGKRYRKVDSRSETIEEFKEQDFKEAPEYWIPSESCVNPETSQLVPDINGHIMGWVPINNTSRQFCWQLETVDLSKGLALVLEVDHEKSDGKLLKANIEKMENMLDCTYELIGTNINGNPYHLGSKKIPIHFLVRHGVMKIQLPESISLEGFKEWFDKSEDGKVEGIVWHFSNGKMYKLHRHHLKLKWPISNPVLCETPIEINFDSDLSFNKYTAMLTSTQKSSKPHRFFKNINRY